MTNYTLTYSQKLNYIYKTYSEEDFIEIFCKMINENWIIVYDDSVPEGEYECTLVINDIEQDKLSKEYAEEILVISL